MKKKYKKIYGILLLTLMVSSSCTKYLDVQRQDSLFEEELFTNATGAQEALNGIYRDLSSSDLYGKNLSLYFVDLAAQYYRTQNFEIGQIITHSYNTTNLRDIASKIWTKGFKTILNVNNFCQKMEKDLPANMSDQQRQNLLAEAYAIRAMLHFDLLRLFGPIPGNAQSAPTIPYIATVQFEPGVFLSFQDITTAITTDLIRARETLAGASGAPAIVDKDTRWRLNYYAVTTLLARVYLYKGMKDEAWKIVQESLPAVEQYFPSVKGLTSGDRMFSQEVLFGSENRELYDRYRELFIATLRDDAIVAPLPRRLQQIYPEANDLRLQAWFATGSVGNKNYQTLVKFTDEDVSQELRYFQPLIRKSELYLIGAETAPDQTTRYELINSLRISRNLQPILLDESLPNAIIAEYAREFIGEGQLFFAYKRLGMGAIPDNGGSSTTIMDATKYNLPIPQEEIKFR
ncbi:MULTISPECIES: RagB/SusD family nutrient uptake outer membrane protein [unclassified Sphingobacterium]|uniref:RagB/SusD family nutrient uptake outer membrane protein n=1 Tax=unclassified Sphingobacterium TaxID=2609468 RepID=UPI00104A9848|nr:MULTISPECIES: RagB/SusD family nutrient uptake outer membrane protein [unclassified Sphingobacterium]MCS3556161.1 hypothetical protein [Sphingobacterium sp. JUb21]TCR08537.1 SusD-like starch-binding protein associating with outer membrane [Sphingobacterium sp. JUb20]